MAETKIGKDLLKMLMFGLYPEPETIYREYVQNATDSLLQAIQLHIIENNEARINIEIDKTYNKIIIEDNGVGLKSDISESTLKNIAMSSKSSINYMAGYFGIGRLVGAGYCKYLRFETSYFNEPKKTEITFDVEAIQRILNDEKIQKDPTAIIDDCTKFNISDELTEKHYFRVILNDVNNLYADKLLDEELIKNYLIQVAPIPYSSPFKKNLLDKAVNNVEDKSIKILYDNYVKSLSQINININQQDELRKNYGLKISGTGDEIVKLQLFVLKDTSKQNFGNLAWGWFAVTKYTKAISLDKTIDGSNPALTRGIRLRLHNILIGNSGYFDGIKYFKQPRSNQYFNGEIHIINDNIKPINDRSDLQPTPETLQLQTEIKNYFRKNLENFYQEANKIKNAVSKLNAQEEQLKLLNTDIEKKAKPNFDTAAKKVELDGIQRQINATKSEIEKIVAKADDDLIKVYGLDKVKKDNKIIQSEKKEIIPLTSPISTKLPDNEKRLQILEGRYDGRELEILKKVFKVLDKRLTTKGQIALLDTIKTEIISSLLK